MSRKDGLGADVGVQGPMEEWEDGEDQTSWCAPPSRVAVTVREALA
jgi:hypothetical protein